MSLLFKRDTVFSGESIPEALARRTGRRQSTKVTSASALRAGAVWACRRLRGDLISTLPLDTYRSVGGIDVEVPKPPVFITPDGLIDWEEWMYSSQDDLDALGNTVGVITQKDGGGLPSRIELVSNDDLSIRCKGGRPVEYFVNGEKYEPEEVWHERQFTRSGLGVGLSPIAHAAMSLGGYLSAQEFAADWFSGGGIPAAHLKNAEQVLKDGVADKVKARFNETVGAGDIFVTGKDWEYKPLSAKASEAQFIEQMKFGVPDICRFLGVPGDMIDAESSTGTVTYANVTQRNLQLLIMNLNPALRRREAAFSRRLLDGPRFARFNRGALLEMDLKSRYEAHQIAIRSRWKVPSEVRELEDLPPLTAEQLDEFEVFAKTTEAPYTSGGSS